MNDRELSAAYDYHSDRLLDEYNERAYSSDDNEQDDEEDGEFCDYHCKGAGGL
ncbi:hypothetical protein [Avibacterium sp. 21-599]|uniref:hypothetical protein n=1 Tax=Avibacterium sp. 21-599 TaxID=2911528 RepID=UPI0022481E11|nr:hypothetical protein [Avibacterium sp. 21-599]MCW9717380.1 hypothetical protein [Avibacterium sp. 21-599]